MAAQVFPSFPGQSHAGQPESQVSRQAAGGKTHEACLRCTYSTKRLDHKDVQKVGGNKVKQELKIKAGIDSDLAKRISKLIKDSGLKVQASIQGDTVRVNGAKRDLLQEAIAFVKKNVTDFPLQFGNFRD